MLIFVPAGRPSITAFIFDFISSVEVENDLAAIVKIRQQIKVDLFTLKLFVL